MVTAKTRRRKERIDYSSASLRLCGNFTLSLVAAVLLLALFAGWQQLRLQSAAEKRRTAGVVPERETLPDTAGWKGRRLAFHDFESGDPADTASNCVAGGHNGNQSLRLRPWAPFSPGLWTRFGDLNPGETAWIRVTGYVLGPPDGKPLPAYLVATCNHNGVNFKYMYIDLEKEKLFPGRWNRLMMDYRIPRAPHPGDVLQAYFWYRGTGEMRVDDIEIEYYFER